MQAQKETADKNIFYTVLRLIVLPINAVQIGFTLIGLKLIDLIGPKLSIADLRKMTRKNCEGVLDMFETDEENEFFREVEKKVIKMIENKEITKGYDLVMTVKKMSGMKYF